MGIDKNNAKKHKYRISEKHIWISSSFFGSYGTCLGILVFHHKIRKRKFIYIIVIMILLQTMILIKLVKFN